MTTIRDLGIGDTTWPTTMAQAKAALREVGCTIRKRDFDPFHD